MERKKISEELSVSSQLSLDDVTFLKAEGIKTIICNRPDGEDVDQLAHHAIQQEAAKNEIDFYFMPVIAGKMTLQDGDEFHNLINRTSKPIHAYCRSGTRCSILWALSELKSGSTRESVLDKAAKAGYDLSKSI